MARRLNLSNIVAFLSLMRRVKSRVGSLQQLGIWFVLNKTLFSKKYLGYLFIVFNSFESLIWNQFPSTFWLAQCLVQSIVERWRFELLYYRGKKSSLHNFLLRNLIVYCQNFNIFNIYYSGTLLEHLLFTLDFKLVSFSF